MHHSARHFSAIGRIANQTHDGIGIEFSDIAFSSELNLRTRRRRKAQISHRTTRYLRNRMMITTEATIGMTAMTISTSMRDEIERLPPQLLRVLH